MSSQHAQRQKAISKREAARKREDQLSLTRLADFIHRHGDSWTLRKPKQFSLYLKELKSGEAVHSSTVRGWENRGWVVRLVGDSLALVAMEVTEAGREALGAYA